MLMVSKFNWVYVEWLNKFIVGTNVGWDVFMLHVYIAQISVFFPNLLYLPVDLEINFMGV
jgi:predicted secreted hydrolase